MARKLNKIGYEATALEGGFDAWKAGFPTESPQTDVGALREAPGYESL
ncbi:MAG: hypothetical protein H0U55_08195 [Rubrobacteraceae bacterium]|nr:hypothetical protein [Rubrobacteraceae bacterium]